MRLWAIYNELGYIPWKRAKKSNRKYGSGVYMGARETIPFLNDDGKRTFSHLLLRPGYLMRDYILRGQHNRYMSPLTALLVFYSFFTLLVAVIQPGASKNIMAEHLLSNLQDYNIEADSTSTAKFLETIRNTTVEALLITHLDIHPEAADTPWKESLAAVEGDMRSKGIPMFLGNFLLLWIAISKLLRKYGISTSGAAAASAYILCQYCVFMLLALLVSFGRESDLGLLVMGALLFIDYRQLLGVGNRKALSLTIRTGLVYLLFATLFYVAVVLLLIAYSFLKA